jgi:hypothetical protein
LTRLVLVGCTKRKLDKPAPARLLYQSRIFSQALRVAELMGQPLILSAQHGAIPPDQVIEPYDLRLSDLSAAVLATWRLVVEVQIIGAADGVPGSIVIFAGRAYAEEVARVCSARGWAAPIEPLAGMGNGPRFRWLRAERWRLEQLDAACACGAPSTRAVRAENASHDLVSPVTFVCDADDPRT